MHHLLYVTVPIEKTTLEDARSYVHQWLLDEGFTSEGRFSNAPSDWFVIGGRWSGYLLEEQPPITDTYATTGFLHDAQLIDERIWEKIKDGFGEIIEEGGAVIDTEGDDYSCEDVVKEEFIGKRYVVVVDFHN